VIIGTDISCPLAREIPTWCHVHLERRVLVNTGCALQLLVDAFYKLKNLSVVGLHNHKIERSRRLGEEKTQRGYGWSLPGTDCCTTTPLGKSERFPHLHRKPPDPIFPLVLHALSVAGARPRSLILDPPGNLPGTCLSIMSGPLARRILLVMNSLRTLHLQLSNERSPLDVHTSKADHLHNLKVLLQHTPLLERLQIDFGLDDSTTPGNFVTWLSLNQSAKIGVPETVKSICLTSLELGALTVIPQALLDIVSSFPTLTSASFREVLLNDDRDVNRVKDIWSEFLRELADRIKRQGALRTLSVRNPAYKRPQSAAVMPVYFATYSSNDRSKLGQTLKYTTHASCDKCCASDVHVWLQELATRIYQSEDATDVYTLSEKDSLSDQSREEDESDESIDSDWSIGRDEIQRMAAASMYEFSEANSL
jgi:hypothetical protein